MSVKARAHKQPSFATLVIIGLLAALVVIGLPNLINPPKFDVVETDETLAALPPLKTAGTASSGQYDPAPVSKPVRTIYKDLPLRRGSYLRLGPFKAGDKLVIGVTNSLDWANGFGSIRIDGDRVAGYIGSDEEWKLLNTPNYKIGIPLSTSKDDPRQQIYDRQKLLNRQSFRVFGGKRETVRKDGMLFLMAVDTPHIETASLSVVVKVDEG